MRRWLPTLALLALLAAPRPAAAHVASLTHSQVDVDGENVRYTIKIAPADLAEALGVPTEPPPTAAQIELGTAKIVAYVTERIDVESSGVVCPAGDGGLVLDADGLVAVSWIARCGAPVTNLAIDYTLFFDLDPTHEAVIRVVAPGWSPLRTILDADGSRLEWDLSEPPPSGTWAFIRSGIDHILFGFDHIAFVLTLLLALVITRDPKHDWTLRSLGKTFAAMGLIVTSFTIAHSITLIAASLGWVRVPSQLVESVIALSIAYTAIENIVRPDVRWRFVLTFGFGLLHGLGFARMLEVLLPPDDVVVPLLAFNVCVELGQLVVVACALPVFWLLARTIGGRNYRRYALPAMSALLAIAGLLWLAERLLEVTILGL
jgi:hypothetical protein